MSEHQPERRGCRRCKELTHHTQDCFCNASAARYRLPVLDSERSQPPDPVVAGIKKREDAFDELWQRKFVDPFSRKYPTLPLYDTGSAKFYVRRAVRFLLTGSVDGPFGDSERSPEQHEFIGYDRRGYCTHGKDATKLCHQPADAVVHQLGNHAFRLRIVPGPSPICGVNVTGSRICRKSESDPIHQAASQPPPDAAPDLYAGERNNGWLPIEFANPDVPVMLWTPPERLYTEPRGRGADIRVAKPRDWTWATHFQSRPKDPEPLLTDQEAALVIGAIPLQALPVEVPAVAETPLTVEAALKELWELFNHRHVQITVNNCNAPGCKSYQYQIGVQHLEFRTHGSTLLEAMQKVREYAERISQ